MRYAYVCMVLLTATMLSFLVRAEVPLLMNYQGQLTDEFGVPVADGDYTIEFRIYSAPVGGDLLWDEEQTVTVEDGLFSVLLGDVESIPDTVFTGDARYLSLQVSPDPEMAERKPIVSIGYAFHALHTDTADYALSAPISSDGDWLINGNVLHAAADYGLSMRQSNVIYGSHDSTHVNFGVACTTGQLGQSYKYCIVAGGQGNAANGPHAAVGGGYSNAARGQYATVGGGASNAAIGGECATVGGGGNNTAGGNSSTVAGGLGNSASRSVATVGGGSGNSADGSASTVGGGRYNRASGDYSVIAGGGGDAPSDSNLASGIYSTIGGGHSNEATDTSATVSGGEYNRATGKHSTIGGGHNHSASEEYATVGGGLQNIASFTLATIGGGYNNVILIGYAATIAGGSSNRAGGTYAAVGGGNINRAEGLNSTVGGGRADTASGDFSTVPGGRANNASGDYSFAAGRRARAIHDGAFVWADSTDAGFSSTDVNQFLIRASGGVGIGTNSPGSSSLVVMEDATGTIGQTVNFQRTQDPSGGNDMLQIRVPSTAPADFQFIECERGTDVEFRVEGDGDVFADGSFTGPADFSEMIAVSGGASAVEPGDVMVIDPRNPRAVKKASSARSRLVSGVYSARPGFIGSARDWDRPAADEVRSYTLEEMAAEFNEIPVAVIGIVPCKVSAENGPIRPGDLLVTSNTAGHAMRDDNPGVGTIVGKALGSLPSGVGVIDVLITLH